MQLVLRHVHAAQSGKAAVRTPAPQRSPNFNQRACLDCAVPWR